MPAPLLSVLRRAVAALGAGAVLLSMALAVPVVSATAAAATDRSDLPLLPRACVQPPDLVPQKALRCRLTPRIKGAPTIVLWGDSHAIQMIPALTSAMGARRVNLVAYVFGSCPPTDPRLRTRAERRAAGQCALTGHKATRYVRNQTKKGRDIRVVLGGFWELYRHLKARGTTPLEGHDLSGLEHVRDLSIRGMPRLFRTLSRLRVPSDVIGQSPIVPAQPPTCSQGRDPYRCDLPRKVALRHEAGNKARLRRWMSSLSGRPRLIQINQQFCTRQQCRGVVGRVNTYADDGHISASLASRMGSYFRSTVKKTVARR